MEVTSSPAVISQRVYGEAVKNALIVVWEAADRIYGKRLKAVIPALVNAMERHGHLKLEAEVRRKLFSVSAATIDRTLMSVRKVAGIRRKKRAAKKVSKEIAIKEALRTQYGQLDPVELLHRIWQGQAALAALSTGEPYTAVPPPDFPLTPAPGCGILCS